MQYSKVYLREQAERIIEECRTLVPEHREKLDGISVKVTTSTRRIGQYVPKTRTVHVSMAFFADPTNFEKEFHDTITHEVAHILSPPYREIGARKWKIHHYAWKRMHRRLGGTGKRTGSMELAAGYVKRRRAARQQVPCPCGCGKNMTLGPTQYKRHLSGQQKYYLKGHSPRRTRKQFGTQDPLRYFFHL